MLERNKSNAYPVQRSPSRPVVKCSHAALFFHLLWREEGSGSGLDMERSQRWMREDEGGLE